MQNGILVYNNFKQKIKFLNNYLSKYDEFNKKNIGQDIQSSSNSANNKNLLDEKLENYNIFNYVIDPNKSLPREVLEFMKMEKFIESADNIYKYFETNKDDFPLKSSMYIGQIKLIEKGRENLFEFYLRHIEIEDSSYLEFMLNNVTYTKIHEIEKTKQKTQILARISHEFKNPLIVSSEIIDEIEDSIKIKRKNLSNTEEIRHNLKFLKNLSLYMLILVKDFEVISSMENNIDNSIYPVKVNLNIFLKEIQEIVEALIKKKNSNNPLNFLVNIDKGLSYFITDPMRLKQILINLISNSIKFTEIGYIELRIEAIESLNDYYCFEPLNQTKDARQIKISVIDTGKGISINKQLHLFNSLSKEMSDNNIMGTGYGLGIVKNLCSMLGCNISYSENDQKGSIFSFTLSESESNNHKEETSHIILNHLNELKAENDKKHNTDDLDIEIPMNNCCLDTIKNLNLYSDSISVNKVNKLDIRNSGKRMLSIKVNKMNRNSTQKINYTSPILSQRLIETSRQTFNLSIHPSFLNIVSNFTNESK